MCLFGAVVNPNDASPSACAAAIADLNLDLAVMTFQYSAAPDWATYDAFCNVIPQVQIMALIGMTQGTGWSSVTSTELASFAAAVKERYAGICYYAIMDEPDNATLYPPSGISDATYSQYYSAVKQALLQGVPVVPHGPNTSQWLSSYNQADGRQWFHGYGALPPDAPRRYYWMTEWMPPRQSNGDPDPITCWHDFMGYGAAIFYQLQDSSDPGLRGAGSGLLDASGNQREPLYGQAKTWLFSPS